MTKRSFYRDFRRLRLGLALIVGPAQGQLAALRRHRGEGDEGIGGDGGEQVGAEDFLAVIGADEAVDDVARDQRSVGAGAVDRPSSLSRTQ